MKISYVVEDKLGGVTSLNYNLVSHCADDTISQEVIHIRERSSSAVRANLTYPKAKNILFEMDRKENLYKTLKGLTEVIALNIPGALILNDKLEMVLLDHYETKRTTYQLVHDDYNVRLAEEYGHVVDVFICHNSVIYQKLIDLFPNRKESVYYLPHGVTIPQHFRGRTESNNQSIKLLFIGRMTPAKGIFDLPVINDLLRKKDVPFEWICIGNGPELDKLKSQWDSRDKVQFLSPKTNEEVLRLSSASDIFVLPTKFEGSPVSLLEAMSLGLVPVVSKIPGGITDIVSKENGFVINVDDNENFAESISILHRDRSLLDSMSGNARKKIVQDFDINSTAAAYFEVFGRYESLYSEKKLQKRKVGSRLDHPFIPSSITRFARTIFGKNG